MPRLHRFRRVNRAMPGVAADLFQSPRNAFRLPRELHRRGVGQIFPLPGNRRLQHPCKKNADRPDKPNRQSRHDQREDDAATFRVTRTAHETQRLQHDAPEHGEHHQPEDPAHEPHVQLHVAVEDVAELVRHHALQFRARQPLQRATRDTDHRVARIRSGGEGVDPLLIVHDPHLRHRNTGSDGHFLHHVEQAPLWQIRRGRLHRPAAEALRDHFSASGKLRELHPASRHDHPSDKDAHPREHLRIPPDEFRRVCHLVDPLRVRRTELPEAYPHHIHHHDDPDHGKDEPPHKGAARSPRPLLCFEEVHLRETWWIRTEPSEPRARRATRSRKAPPPRNRTCPRRCCWEKPRACCYTPAPSRCRPAGKRRPCFRSS